ncbi:hypothetical protein BDN72DRAFT_758884 [Pluteus cervinus]|uniref:Uncharacterized protein n=1 Tax=Pluteus cervinus TaxID=181527 RepID=A0ACD3BB98_9AGAR|nr:hypothetical protein BDN72DRAFT_758884 [Pluteus cervinus]
MFSSSFWPCDTNPSAYQSVSDPGIYTYRQQAQFFREALTLPTRITVGPFVQQPIYKPHTNSDRKRYVEEVLLDPPIFFRDTEGFYGIRLVDALRCKFRGLESAEEAVFQGRGPSVSIRLEWPGYRRWSRQIPTRDFRTPPGPITRAKLAKSVAKCVQRFVEDREGHNMEDDSDPKWKVGRDPSTIRLEDLVLVSIYHVSMGSWQPHLRLLRSI